MTLAPLPDAMRRYHYAERWLQRPYTAAQTDPDAHPQMFWQAHPHWHVEFENVDDDALCLLNGGGLRCEVGVEATVEVLPRRNAGLLSGLGELVLPPASRPFVEAAFIAQAAEDIDPAGRQVTLRLHGDGDNGVRVRAHANHLELQWRIDGEIEEASHPIQFANEGDTLLIAFDFRRGDNRCRLWIRNNGSGYSHALTTSPLNADAPLRPGFSLAASEGGKVDWRYLQLWRDYLVGDVAIANPDLPVFGGAN